MSEIVDLWSNTHLFRKPQVISKCMTMVDSLVFIRTVTWGDLG